MVAKFLDLDNLWSCKHDRKKRRKILTRITILCMIAFGDKTVAHNFIPSFDNANGRLCQERLLRTRNLILW